MEHPPSRAAAARTSRQRELKRSDSHPGVGKLVESRRWVDSDNDEPSQGAGPANAPHTEVGERVKGRTAEVRNTRLGADVSAVAWEPPPSLDIHGWAEYGRRFGRLGAGSNWWIGDWVRFGNARYDDRYKLAAKLTGLDKKTLMNLTYVSSRFPFQNRRPEVSWSHHAELTAFADSEQRRWLARVATDRLSLRDLRQELRASRRRSGDAHSAPTDVQPASTLTCPTCGRRLPRSH
jgi:hypothetical protein